MANTYFQFKQFRVEQDKCAMKVCTDACILGAFTRVKHTTRRILDIGTGTGLLALMLAQRSSALIDAVEIEGEAAEQAKENFANSPWKDKISLHHQSIQSFADPGRQKYDLIICNPPFFPQSLKSPQTKINIASHSTELNLSQLVIAMDKLLSPEGECSIMLPPFEFGLLCDEMQKYHLNPQIMLKIQNTENSPVIRIIGCFAREIKGNAEEIRLIIREKDNRYTNAFAELMKDYYLHL